MNQLSKEIINKTFVKRLRTDKLQEHINDDTDLFIIHSNVNLMKLLMFYISNNDNYNTEKLDELKNMIPKNRDELIDCVKLLSQTFYTNINLIFYKDSIKNISYVDTNNIIYDDNKHTMDIKILDNHDLYLLSDLSMISKFF